MGLFTGVTVMTALQYVQQGCVSSILKLVQRDQSDQSLVLMGMLLPGAEWLSLCFSSHGRCAQKGVGFGRCLGQQWAGSCVIKPGKLQLSRCGQTALVWEVGIGPVPLKS